VLTRGGEIAGGAKNEVNLVEPRQEPLCGTVSFCG